MRVYETFVAVELTDSKYTWAGSDRSKLLITQDTNIPSTISASTKITKNPSKTTHSGTHVVDLTSPLVFDGLVVMDGVISGQCKFSVGAKDTGSGNITGTQVDLKLVSEDSSGAETTLLDETIWTGSIYAVVGGTSEDSKGIMFWYDVSDATIGVQNRLKATFTLSYSVVDSLGGGYWKLGSSAARRFLNQADQLDTAVRNGEVIV